MYLDFIEALPLSITGLAFIKNMSFLSDKVSIATIANRCKSNISRWVKFVPDILIPGDYHFRDKLFDLDPQLREKPDHYLLVTGIPDNVPSLDFFKFKDAIYTRYFEAQDNKGYLFQVVPSTSPFIPISYGTC